MLSSTEPGATDHARLDCCPVLMALMYSEARVTWAGSNGPFHPRYCEELDTANSAKPYQCRYGHWQRLAPWSSLLRRSGNFLAIYYNLAS